MENTSSTDPARRAANLVLRTLGTIEGKLSRTGTVEERLFGPKADSTPYREVLAPWISQRDRLYPTIHRVIGFLYRFVGATRVGWRSLKKR